MNKSQKTDIMVIRARMKADESEFQHDEAWNDPVEQLAEIPQLSEEEELDGNSPTGI